MDKKNFADVLIDEIIKKQSYLCIGLDPQLRYFPPHILSWAYTEFGPGFKASVQAIIKFNYEIINATQEYALCYKPQIAFYEQFGSDGIKAFEKTIEILDDNNLLYITDAKREDGDDTARAYANGHLGEIDIIGPENGELTKVISPINTHAITITPWIEMPCFLPFIETAKLNGKGVFVVDKSSFKPASSLQESITDNGKKLWQILASKLKGISDEMDLYGKYNYSFLGMVMGATYPLEAEEMKNIFPNSFKLVPGFGAGQGGAANNAVICINNDGFGAIINNSRGTNYAYHPKFKTNFICDSKNYDKAASLASKQAKDELNNAVLIKNGKLPW